MSAKDLTPSKKAQQVLDVSRRLTSIEAERRQLITELELLVGGGKKVSIPVVTAKTKVVKKKARKIDSRSDEKLETLALKVLTKTPGITVNALANKIGTGYYRLKRILESMEAHKVIRRTDGEAMGRAVIGWHPVLRNGKGKSNGHPQARA